MIYFKDKNILDILLIDFTLLDIIDWFYKNYKILQIK